jgi:hypothetical protein
MEDDAEAGKPVGAPAIALERRLNEDQRGIQASALIINLAEAVQRVEIFGVLSQQRIVEPFGLRQLAGLVRAQRLAQHARNSRLQSLQREIRHA